MRKGHRFLFCLIMCVLGTLQTGGENLLCVWDFGKRVSLLLRNVGSLDFKPSSPG